MKFFRSLTFRLLLCVFFGIAIATLVTGGWYYLLAIPAIPIPHGAVELMRSPLQLLMMSLVLSTVLSGMFAHNFVRPVVHLSEATKRVAEGDFTVRVEEPPTEDEMTELIRSFNHMTAQLGASELFKKDFINSFSHEFKTPIVSVRGFARQLLREDLSPETRREYLEIIVRESERLSDMSTNVLLLTRLENEQIRPEIVRYRLDEQLRRTVLLLEKQWSGKELETDVDLPETFVESNEELLSHVFLNLIGNAVKFTPPGGRICVRCMRTPGNRIIAAVEDSGPGMDEETQRRIFDRFFQGESSHASEGNGLGLTLAKRITELLGGTIRVESAPGEGSRFTVELPG